MLQSLVAGLVRTGTFDLTLPGSGTRRYGDGTGKPVAVTITDPALVRRLALRPDLAVGEGYMEGSLTIAGDDLHGFLGLILANTARGTSVWWRRPFEAANYALRRFQMHNPAARSRQNVAHHYDLSSELYALFLDEDRQYSCAYFRTPDDTLEQAQRQKKAHIAGKLLLRPGLRVLDIGCGWGGMAITLARDYGVHVLGVTLSEEQHRIANERVRAAGLQDRVEIRLTDYRDVTGRFDRIVSVGMFEHVGVPQFRTYFRKVQSLLAEDGVALIHTIGRAEPPSYTSGFILKYIFPGGYVPAMSEMTRAIEAEGLWPADVEVWRLHYAETLRHWHERFMARADRVRAIYDDRFIRMWRFYLVASEMAFRAGRQCVFQVQLSRRLDAVPVTRDYLYAPPAPAQGQGRPRPVAAAE
ncbi:MAG: Cyclopropane-fatty-acyl-phospholipid synthase [Pseudomonadota bacterium]